MAAVKKAGRLWKQGTGVELTEWKKDGWTYHAKGPHFHAHSSAILTHF